MIKQYNGAKAEQSVAAERLPAGAYVAKIMGAEVVSYSWGEQLVISFDIAEGEHKDFFAADYRRNTNADKKWRGTYRATIPDENNQYFDGQRRTFNNIMFALEESNNGYRFDWDEKRLKGLLVGIIMRDEEWEYNGKTGWRTSCCKLVKISDVREGNIRLPEPKPLKNSTTQQSETASDAPALGADDLPF